MQHSLPNLGSIEWSLSGAQIFKKHFYMLLFFGMEMYGVTLIYLDFQIILQEINNGILLQLS